MDPAAMPSDLSAEQAVLASLFQANDKFPEVMAFLSEDDFLGPANRAIYKAMVGDFEDGRPVDLHLIRDKLARAGNLLLVGGEQGLIALFDTQPTGSNAVYYGNLVAECASKRRIIAVAESIVKSAMNGAVSAEVLEAAKLSLSTLVTPGTEVDPFRTVAELSASAEAVTWVWEKYLAVGHLMLLVGPPKLAGKSFLTYAFVASIEQGLPFLGEPTVKGPCVILSEEPDVSVADKCKTFGIQDSAFITRQDRIPHKTLGQRCQQAKKRADKMGAKVIVIDTMLFWGDVEDENDAATMQKTLNPVLDLAAQGFAVILIHHTNKGQGTGGNDIRGSSAITGLVDRWITLKRVEGEPGKSRLREMTLEGRSPLAIEEPSIIELHEVEGAPWYYTQEGATAVAKTTMLEADILAAVAREPWQSAAELATTVNKDDKTVGRLCKDMAWNHKLVVAGDGKRGNAKRYAIPGSEAAVEGPRSAGMAPYIIPEATTPLEGTQGHLRGMRPPTAL